VVRNLICFAIIAFNIFDCYSTGIVLSMGLGYEANPIAAYVIEHMGIWASVPKLLIAITAAIFFWRNWEYSKALRVVAAFVAVVYTLLAIYQVCMLATFFIFAG